MGDLSESLPCSSVSLRDVAVPGLGDEPSPGCSLWGTRLLSPELLHPVDHMSSGPELGEDHAAWVQILSVPPPHCITGSGSFSNLLCRTGLRQHPLQGVRRQEERGLWLALKGAGRAEVSTTRPLRVGSEGSSGLRSGP